MGTHRRTACGQRDCTGYRQYPWTCYRTALYADQISPSSLQTTNCSLTPSAHPVQPAPVRSSSAGLPPWMPPPTAPRNIPKTPAGPGSPNRHHRRPCQPGGLDRSVRPGFQRRQCASPRPPRQRRRERTQIRQHQGRRWLQRIHHGQHQRQRHTEAEANMDQLLGRWRSDDRPAVRGDQGTRSGNGCLLGRANELVSKYYMRPTRSEQATESRPYGWPNA